MHSLDHAKLTSTKHMLTGSMYNDFAQIMVLRSVFKHYFIPVKMSQVPNGKKKEDIPGKEGLVASKDNKIIFHDQKKKKKLKIHCKNVMDIRLL